MLEVNKNISQLNSNKKTAAPLIRLSWKDNPSAQKLLDVIASVLAEEYIEVAKKNNEIFKEGNYAG